VQDELADLATARALGEDRYASMGAAHSSATSGTLARQGCKAEPLRIQFRLGRDNATVDGTLSG
jgi:hypothetical protein